MLIFYVISLVVVSTYNNGAYNNGAYNNAKQQLCVNWGANHWAAQFGGEYQYAGIDLFGKPYYYQSLCPSIDYTQWNIDNCIYGRILRIDPFTNRWTFSFQNRNQNQYEATCLDDHYNDKPDFCNSWFSAGALNPIITPGPCPTTTNEKPQQLKVNRFIISNDYNDDDYDDDDDEQYLEVKENFAFIDDADILIDCHLKGDLRYIMMNEDDFDDLDIDIDFNHNDSDDDDKDKDNPILFMVKEVFDDIKLLPQCKFPIFRILSYPEPEIFDDNDTVKIYVTTGVSMFEYIQEIDVDLKDIELYDIDDDFVSTPFEDDIEYEEEDLVSMDGIEFNDIAQYITDYDIECVADCDDFDKQDLMQYLQEEFYQYLLLKVNETNVNGSNSSNITRLGTIPIGQLDHVFDTKGIEFEYLDEDDELDIDLDFGFNDDDITRDDRRRLGWGIFKKAWNWVKKIVKTVAKAVVRIGRFVYELVKGEVDEKLAIGINEEITKSYTFSSGYKRKIKKDNVDVDIKGELTIEAGAKFVLEIYAKLKAKWTIIPPKFEHFRFTVGGHTEFKSWIRAEISAYAKLNMLLFKKEKTRIFYLGPVPIVVTLEAQVNLGLSTEEIHAVFHQTVGYKPIGVEFGIEYVDGQWLPIKDINLHFEWIKDRGIEIMGKEVTEKSFECPLEWAVDVTLTPDFKIKLEYLVYAGLETEFGVKNTFEIGASCIDNMDTCDIIHSSSDTITARNKLGIKDKLNLNAEIALLLGADISIPGLDIHIYKYEKKIIIAQKNFELGSICEEVSIIDTLMREICDCPTVSPTKSPTPAPTNNPTNAPTQAPTASPTPAPTDNPTNSPSSSPTNSPTPAPTRRKMCIWGTTNFPQLGLIGEYQYNGQDEDGEDFWELDLDINDDDDDDDDNDNDKGEGCPYKTRFYLRKKKENGKWEIVVNYKGIEYSLATCIDFVETPDQCIKWIINKELDIEFDEIDANNLLKVIGDECPILSLKSNLNVTNSKTNLCNGQYRKSLKRKNLYISTDDNMKKTKSSSVWFYRNQYQKWQCEYFIINSNEYKTFNQIKYWEDDIANGHSQQVLQKSCIQSSITQSQGDLDFFD